MKSEPLSYIPIGILVLLFLRSLIFTQSFVAKSKDHMAKPLKIYHWLSRIKLTFLSTYGACAAPTLFVLIISHILELKSYLYVLVSSTAYKLFSKIMLSFGSEKGVLDIVDELLIDKTLSTLSLVSILAASTFSSLEQPKNVKII